MPFRWAMLLVLAAVAAAQSEPPAGRAGEPTPADASPSAGVADRPASPTATAPAADESPAGRGEGRPGRPEFGRQTLSTSYEPSIAFRQRAGRDDELGWFGHDLRLSVPLHQDESNEWLLRAQVAVLDFYGDARLPDPRWWWRSRRVAFPDQLWNVQLGTSYRRKLANDWIVGGTFTVGSPSDEPFASGDDIAVSFNGALRVPAGESGAWLFSLNWSNVRDFAQYVPLPGVGYAFGAGPMLDGVVGFPFSRVDYRPVDWLVLRGSYFFPRTIDTEVAVPIAGWELFTGYEWRNEAWLWSQRREDDDRLRYYEQAVRLGVRSPAFLAGRARLEVEGGYAFQRYWYVGDDYTERDEARLGVGDGPYGKVQLRVEF